jgi:phage regulator Rha-like protein
MLDYDLAELYQESTKRLNQQVTRNIKRFPHDFMFPLSNQEVGRLKLQIATSKQGRGGRRKPTLAFTEQGIAMLSSVLRSERAIDVNIAIMRAFVRLRHVLNSNTELEKKSLNSKVNLESFLMRSKN